MLSDSDYSSSVANSHRRDYHVVRTILYALLNQVVFSLQTSPTNSQYNSPASVLARVVHVITIFANSV